jgi:hypothetical protein
MSLSMPAPQPGPQGPAAGGGMPAPMSSGPPPVTIDAVVKLLRDDRMRGFRIDVETDSLIEADQNAEKQRRTEFVQAVGQFMVQMGPMVQVMPPIAPMVAGLLKFAVHSYKVGGELEELIETTMEHVQEFLGQPKPPPPASPDEMVKLEGTKAKTAAEVQKATLAVQEAQFLAQSKQIEAQREAERAQREHAQAIALANHNASIALDAHTMEQERLDREHQRNMELKGLDHQAKAQEMDRKQIEAATPKPEAAPKPEPKADDGTSTKLLALLTQALVGPKKIIRDAKGDAIGVEHGKP